MTTFVTDREFDRATSEALRATVRGPVFITAHGEPTHVLLTVEQYEKLTGKPVPKAEELAADR